MWQASIQWRSRSFSGDFVPMDPSAGVRVPALGTSFLGLALDGQPIPACQESYIRGNDVFVDCPADRRQVGIQAYYRDLIGPDTPDAVPGIELVVSAQTDSLGIPIQLQVVSTTAGKVEQRTDSVWTSPSEHGANEFRWLDEQGNVVAVQIVHPSDFSRATLEGQTLEDQTLTCHLFGEPLEKGVIRRGRVRCYFGALSDEKIDELECEFREAPLPLTT